MAPPARLDARHNRISWHRAEIGGAEWVSGRESVERARTSNQSSEFIFFVVPHPSFHLEDGGEQQENPYSAKLPRRDAFHLRESGRV